MAGFSVFSVRKFISIMCVVGLGTASAATLPAVESNQIVFNFDGSAVSSSFSDFVRFTFSVQSAQANSQLNFDLYGGLNATSLDLQGSAVVSGPGTPVVNLSSTQAPVDGKFSLGVYAPVGQIGLTSILARVTTSAGQVVFLDGVVSNVPEPQALVFLLTGLLPVAYWRGRSTKRASSSKA
jgi:hypothetical protein